jgi:hypothetical protein
MEGPCADSEEKREPAGDIYTYTVVVDGLKVLDPKRPIREADILSVPLLRKLRSLFTRKFSLFRRVGNLLVSD